MAQDQKTAATAPAPSSATTEVAQEPTSTPAQTSEKRAYFFPAFGKTVQASSREEAEQMIKNITD